MVWDKYRKLMMPFDVFTTAHYEGNYFKDKCRLFFTEALMDCTERGRPSFTHWCLDL